MSTKSTYSLTPVLSAAFSVADLHEFSAYCKASLTSSLLAIAVLHTAIVVRRVGAAVKNMIGDSDRLLRYSSTQLQIVDGEGKVRFVRWKWR